MTNPKIPNTKENIILIEQFYTQVSESIQCIFDLTSRIDERVKMLIQDGKITDEKLQKLADLHGQIITRLTMTESIPNFQESITEIKAQLAATKENKKEIEDLKGKFQEIHIKQETMAMRIGNHDNRWTIIFDAIWKVGLMIVAGYILYKLGLPTPS